MRGPPAIQQRAGYRLPPSNEATAGTVVVPAPVGGWNTRDALASMPALDAVVMDNIWPSPTSVGVRAGRITWASGITGNVRAFLAYNATTKSELFVATGSGIFNVTAEGVVGAQVTTSSDGNWQSYNFSNSGGSFILAVNGVQSAKLYDGTTWEDVTAISTHAITGILTSRLTNITLFKHRIWFVEKQSNDLWYLGIDAIGGAAVKFPMGPVFKLGGYVVAQSTWSIDGGAGLDDFLVTVTSEGEAAVYQGSDPEDASGIALVGVYYVGRPIGKKCFVKYGGDLLYLSEQGIMLFSKLLISASIDRNTAAVSSKIDLAVSFATQSYGTVPGWEMTLYSNQDALIVNAPVTADRVSYQFVMNTITKAWCRFLAWDATCFMVFNGELYSALGSKVYKNWTGHSDDGVPIQGLVQQAYNRLGGMYQKNISLVQPNITLNGSGTLTFRLDADFQAFTETSQIAYIQNWTTAIWDEALWDYSSWDASGYPTKPQWMTIPNNPGYLHSFRLQISTSTASFDWISTNYAIRRAGIL